MESSPALEAKLKALVDKGVLEPRTENNKYLKLSYKGKGGLISPKWNIKIYTSGSIVSTDLKLVEDILHDNLKEADASLKVLKIDDAGVGFPLCGVAVGIASATEVFTDFISVKYFQSPLFENHAYLKAYADAGYTLLIKKFKADPKTHRIEICTGYINMALRDMLWDKGFDVRVVEITGLLQDTLEKAFREHVKEKTHADLGYDPKEYPDKSSLARKYYAVLDWGKKYAPQLLKSGWRSMKCA